MTSNGARAGRTAWLGTWALGLTVGLAVSWRVLLEPGVVGLVHDWSIPPFAEQNVALLRQMFEGWYRWGLGLSIAYPLEYPLRLGFAAASLLGAGGAALSKAVVVLVPAASFVCAAVLARACRLPRGAAWLAGAFYALDPVMLNKLVSGQTTYLCGYALLPLVPAAFLVASRRERPIVEALAIGALVALVAMQLQLGVIAFVLLILLAIFSARVPLGRRVMIVAVASVVAVLVETPTLVWLSHGVTGLEQLDQFGHGAAWLQANSIPPLDAVRLIGYLAHYDVASTVGWTLEWDVASWLVLAAVAVGLGALSGPMRPVAVIVVLTTLPFVSGTNTVLGPAIAWLFVNVPAAQVFRELYHAMAAVSLAYALAVAACLQLVWRVPQARPAGVALLAAVAVYVAPMLSGDISGWLRAAPIDRYLSPVFYDENRGPGRVAWFPLDQPLAFTGSGAGVDPMGVTERGSLWLYALTWPLTAVDMSARTGDMPLLRSELRALGVATAVDRSLMRSRYASFSADPTAAHSLFDRPLAFDATLGPSRVYGPDLVAYSIEHHLPVGFAARRYALVPRRLRVAADVSLGGIATFGFGQSVPAGVPYDVYYDGGDLAWEAVELSGLARPPLAPGVDAHRGFAGGDVWWWYRPAYADSRRFALALGRAETTLSASSSLRDARLVVAWIATGAGGELQVDCGGTRRVVDTGGAWQDWRSTVLDCGPLAAGSRVRLRAIDDGADVALRGAQLIEDATLRTARRELAAVFRRAGRVVAVGEASGRPSKAIRAGRGSLVDGLPLGVRAILEVERAGAGNPSGPIRVERPDGYVVAWRRFAHGRLRAALPLVGERTSLRIRSPGSRISGWRLLRLLPATALPGSSLPARDGGRLLVWNQTYDRGWRVDGATAHLASALGTNVFVLPRAPAGPEAHLAYAGQYRVAFAFGTLVLLASLACSASFAVRGGVPS
jgi:hypothetical protein